MSFSATYCLYLSIAASGSKSVFMPCSGEKVAFSVELHNRGILIKEAVAVAGSESHTVVLGWIVRRGDVGGGLELLFPGDIAQNSDGDNAKAVDLAARGQDSIQESLLE